MHGIGTTEFLAGGTDLMERRRSGVASKAPHILTPDANMRAIHWRDDGGADVGASVSIDQLARDPRIAAAYPALAAAAGGLATPEIRRMATVGGNLTQRSRCWYFRNPEIACLKKGGNQCPARAGNHLYGVVFDLGPCVAPHPSTLGAAFLAYPSTVTTSERRGLAVVDVFGNGSDGTRDHRLADDEILLVIHLPPPVPGERAIYNRAISRAHAEWPLAEIVARMVVDNGQIIMVAMALGGVAPVPIRLAEVEAALLGKRFASLDMAEIAKRAVMAATPLPQTGYKVALVKGLVADALERLVA